MTEGLINIGLDLFVVFVAFYFCRQSSVYYDTLRWTAHIKIRSNLICWLFISQVIKGRNGRLVYVAPQDEHKMTCIGLLSHLIVDSLAVRFLYVSIQYYFFQVDQPFYVVQRAFIYLMCTAMSSALISTVNQYKVR